MSDGTTAAEAADDDLVGLVPAAGRGTRISPLPFSKELFPVGFLEDAGGAGPRPKAAAHHLLEKMRSAGARRGILVLRDGKWDIPSYFGHGEIVGMNLGYVVMRRPFGVPFTVDDARPFVRGATVLFGFPDILFRPDDVFSRLLERRRTSEADVAVAVFPVHRPEKTDRVRLDDRGGIASWDTTPEGEFEHTWVAAAWGPGFTDFLHELLAQEEADVRAAGGAWRGREMSMGDVMWEAVRSGLEVEPVVFGEGRYIDIGTPDDLATAVRVYAGEE